MGIKGKNCHYIMENHDTLIVHFIGYIAIFYIYNCNQKVKFLFFQNILLEYRL